MLAALGNLKALSITSAIVATLAFGGGWSARDYMCDAAEHKRRAEALHQEVQRLERLIARHKLIAEKDAQLHEEHGKEIQRLEGLINDTKTDDGVCFSPDDAERVRNLWK
jgi:hypothetical protein